MDKTKHLIATARDVEKATELKQLAAKHPNLHILQLEVSDYKRHDSLVAEIEKIVGDEGLTLSIMNAGMMIPEVFEESKPDSYAKTFDVNAVAPLLLTRQLIPLLEKSAAGGKRAAAVFVSSLLGSIELSPASGLSQYVAYSMSKSALNQGVRTMANHYKDKPIEFVIFHPGHVATDMGNRAPIKPPVTPAESVSGMLKHLADTNLTKDGRMICWDGRLLPW